MPRISRSCANCRAVKRRCDRQFPHCGQCTRSSQTCPGYRDEWELVFRDQTDRTIQRTEAKHFLKLAQGIRQSKDGKIHSRHTPFTGRTPYSWGELCSLQPATIPDSNPTELRSLAYFRQVVAPVLSGPLGRSFWTHMVHQVAHQDLAARHAAVAISALYEQLDQSPSDAGVPFTSGFALRQYNRAIKSIAALRTPSPSDLDTVLLVCILFACIEFLQGGIESALQHCRYGSRILSFHTPKPELLPILRHLSIFPLLYTKRLPDHLPPADQCSAAPDSFQSVAEAQEALDVLTYRLVGLSRVRDHYSASRLSSSHHLAPLIPEQRRVIRDLEAWQSAMNKLRSRELIPQEHETIDRILQARWTAGITWAAACLDYGEGAYDAYMDRFERVIELASHAIPTAGSPSSKSPKFMFEMGFVSAVYFVAIKCRRLPLRLKALSMLTEVGCLKETMWDRNDMKMIALQIIEHEHDIKLTLERIEEVIMMGECHPMPAEDRRIGDSGQGEDEGQETGSATKMIFHLNVSSICVEIWTEARLGFLSSIQGRFTNIGYGNIGPILDFGLGQQPSKPI